MPFGDGTGPFAMGSGAGWSRGWCRGPWGGRGGHGWRNVDRATGAPPWMRGGWWDAGGTRHLAFGAGERDFLRRQAEALETELRWVRARLEEIGEGTGEAG